MINLQADGSAMYTVQALWTQAREKLPVTTVILSNRKYQILLGEYPAGARAASARAAADRRTSAACGARLARNAPVR